MPVTATVGQTVPASAAEFDASGNPVAIADPSALEWVSSDTTIATVTINSDGTAAYKGIAAGTVTATATDPGNGLTGEDTITFVAPVATTLKVVFGTPA